MARLKKVSTAAAIADSQAVITAQSRSLPPRLRTRYTPTKPSASSAGSFTEAAATISAAPPVIRHHGRTVSSRPSITQSPSSSSGSMIDSLWIPLTMWNSTSGFAAPSHRTRPASRSNREASRGSTHTIRATPSSASSRCSRMPSTTFSPDSAVIPRPRPRNSGP